MTAADCAGLARCGWAAAQPDYWIYHDTEWGVPLHGTDALFERLSLEAFQAGLSWLTVLRKRPALRSAFAGFRVETLARWGADEVARLLDDSAIVRNRRKIEAVLANARVAADLHDDLDELLWSFAPPASGVRPVAAADIPAVTPESTAMAAELKRRGFSFVGPTTCYALMQATGMVDDHLAGCFRSAG